MVDLPLSGHHPVPSSHEVHLMAFGMKAHSLLFIPSFFKSFSSFSRARRLGEETPCSHFETADNDTFNFLAKSSWVNPNSSLIALPLKTGVIKSNHLDHRFLLLKSKFTA